MKFQIIAAMAIGATLAMAGQAAQAANLTVLGTDDIFAAGLGAPPASTGGGGTLPSFVTVTPGEQLFISASGTVECCVGSSTPSTGPDGFATNPFGSGSDISDSAGTGFGDFVQAVGSFPLAGAFTTTGGAALGSVFQVGSSDTVTAPAGAGRLYFGLPDASGFNGPSGFYADNAGSFAVSVSAVPEPATWAMMLIGFGGLGAALRRSRGRQALLTA